MDNIKESLTRKLGPLPVWAWAIIGGIALFVIRSRMTGSSGQGTSPSAAQTQAQAQLIAAEGAAQMPPQSPQILSPGESVYDPNSGLLQGGSASGTGLSRSLLDLIAALMLAKPHPKRTGINQHGPPFRRRHRGHHHIHHGHHDHKGHHQSKHPQGKKKGN